VKYFTKSYIFLYLVVFVALFVLYKSVSLPYYGNIEVTISKQKGSIATVDTARNITNKQVINVKRIIFENSRALKHKHFGYLGFSENFFVDAVVDMDVLKSAKYRFEVQSDDGFRLKIDDKTVCAHPENRPFQKTECEVELKKGLHPFHLEYFQGGGPLGLHVRYALKGEKLQDFGVDSKYIVFKEKK
jgi:hypothetical protein